MAKDFLTLPVGYSRVDDQPLLDDQVFDTYEEAEAFVQTNPTAYLGQIISVGVDGIYQAYIIASDKTLVPIGSGGTGTYVGVDSDTISMTINNSSNTISAEVKIDEEDPILYVNDKGIATGITVEQVDDTVYIYGKDGEVVVGSFELTATLLSYRIIKNITEEDVEEYFPRQVDGQDYDPNTNPVILGDTYIIFTMGTNENSRYKYNLYLNTSTLLDIPISEDEGNLLMLGSDGKLYVSVTWQNLT